MKLTPSSEYPVLNDVYFYVKQHKTDLTIARSETAALSYLGNSCSSSLVYRNFRDENSLFRGPFLCRKFRFKQSRISEFPR